jgi:tryptophan-rich sensory protein
VGDDHLVRYGCLAGLQWVAVAPVPYFVWVSTATVIQVSITAMNGS